MYEPGSCCAYYDDLRNALATLNHLSLIGYQEQNETMRLGAYELLKEAIESWDEGHKV